MSHLPRQRKRTLLTTNGGNGVSPRIVTSQNKRHKQWWSIPPTQLLLVLPLLVVSLYLLTYFGLVCHQQQQQPLVPPTTFPQSSSPVSWGAGGLRHAKRLWRNLRQPSNKLSAALVVFPRTHRTASFPHLDYLTRYLEPDYGGLRIASLLHNQKNGLAELRRVYNSTEDEVCLRAERRELFDSIEQAITENDDDVTHWFDPYDDLEYDKERRHPKWMYDARPSCNLFHESVALNRAPEEYDITFLDDGGFRSTYLMNPAETSHDPIVLKVLRTKREFDRYNMRNIGKEPLLMSIMNRKWTSATYGHCATSVMVEKGVELYPGIVPTNGRDKTGRIPQTELDKLQRTDVKPQNKLTTDEKVEIAVAMAEGIEQLHSLGISHSDISLYQWLRSANDGRVVLNDFNHAEFMLWSDNANKFRKFYTHYDWGTWKAPEEYRGDYTGRSADVWSFGDLLFVILTGTYR